jgi:osmotically-inducible protein OsmY
MKRDLLSAGLGAALAFFLDPELGRRRRAMTRDRAVAIARRGGRRLDRLRRKMRSDIAGKQARIAHSLTPVPLPVNDETLRDRVESELFRDPDIPKGQININAEHGVVVLRGELDHPEEINAVERRVKKIAGVTEVRNLLHLTGTRLRAA